MDVDGGVLVRAFDATGWGWGGRWSGASRTTSTSRRAAGDLRHARGGGDAAPGRRPRARRGGVQAARRLPGRAPGWTGCSPSAPRGGHPALVDERRRVAELFVRRPLGRLEGRRPLRSADDSGHRRARDTRCRSRRGRGGRDRSAVLPARRRALLGHFTAAASACAPSPSTCTSSRRRAATRCPGRRLELRGRAPNLAGLKVSDTPWERFEPYSSRAWTYSSAPRRSSRAVSARVRRRRVRARDGVPRARCRLRTRAVGRARRGLAELRAAIERFPRHAALKHVLRLGAYRSRRTSARRYGA